MRGEEKITPPQDYKDALIAPLTHGRSSARLVGPADIEPIRIWRNAQIEVLRQKAPLSKGDQLAYYSGVVWPQNLLSHPSQILFAIFYDDVRVGYGGLVHISWDDLRAEFSFLLDPEVEANARLRVELFGSFLAMMEDLAFRRLELNKLTTETFAFRKGVIQLLEECGFVFQGALRAHSLVGNEFVDSILHARFRAGKSSYSPRGKETSKK